MLECSRILQACKIHSALYHLIGPLQHATNAHPQFEQVFLYDLEDSIERLHNRPGRPVLSEAIEVVLLQQLLNMLHSCNSFIAMYYIIDKRMQDAVANIS